MSHDDPRRLLDDPATGDAMRRALEAGRAETPSEAQLDQLWARLGPLIGPGGPGGDAPGDAGPGDAGPGDAGPGDAGPGDAGP
ncbi:MAG TPA: hypothetical protein RMH99_05220, partial [Sandaracinaceae bacterium LLY-WYZ-13_1]|nr:hypothetical protein [Sandaracinaceae bacterium LLY-WYZ-13_1]